MFKFHRVGLSLSEENSLIWAGSNLMPGDIFVILEINKEIIKILKTNGEMGWVSKFHAIDRSDPLV